MKRKYFTYILLVVVSLFVFNSRVEADEKDGYHVTCSKMNLSSNYKIFDPKNYDVSCVYKLDVSSGWWIFEENNCVVVQIAYNNDSKSSKKVKFKSLTNSWEKSYDNVSFDVTSDITKGDVGTSCPSVLYFHLPSSAPNDGGGSYSVKRTSGGSNSKSMRLFSSFYNGNAELKIGSSEAKFEDEDLSCENILGDDLIDIFQAIVSVVKIGVPILLIVFGVLDFGKAIFSFDEGEMKKAQTKFIKRLMIGIAFFLIPTFLGVILDIAHGIWPNIDNTLCGIDF